MRNTQSRSRRRLEHSGNIHTRKRTGFLVFARLHRSVAAAGAGRTQPRRSLLSRRQAGGQTTAHVHASTLKLRSDSVASLIKSKSFKVSYNNDTLKNPLMHKQRSHRTQSKKAGTPCVSAASTHIPAPLPSAGSPWGLRPGRAAAPPASRRGSRPRSTSRRAACTLQGKATQCRHARTPSAAAWALVPTSCPHVTSRDGKPVAHVSPPGWLRAKARAGVPAAFPSGGDSPSLPYLQSLVCLHDQKRLLNLKKILLPLTEL